MNGDGARLPALARRLLSWAANRLKTPELAGGAAELFAERARRDGERAARWWYRRQAADALVRVLVRAGRSKGGRGAAAWVGGMSLDFRLGFRLLVKYPGLTLIGGLAMAFGIWVGATGFEFATRLVLPPRLPVEGADRIVTIQNRAVAASRLEQPALHDFTAWREKLSLIEDLGAFRRLDRNLIMANRAPELVGVAEISASAFTMGGVRPLLGRPLVAGDEQPGAAPVAVVGNGTWRRFFDGDSAIIGQSIRLGQSMYTLVGVMPPGFVFPISQSFWVPLRLNAGDYQPGRDPRLTVFGRLARGTTLGEAQAELAALGPSAASAIPGELANLRPEVVPYAKSLVSLQDLSPVMLLSIYLFLILLVVLICGNVALLMFARAATRESEMVVRNALGASRGRIIGQLFAEALVLAAVSATIGLVAADLGVRWRLGFIEAMGVEAFPAFWDRDGLDPMTVLYGGLLAVVAALVAGVVPALKVTRGLAGRLRRASPGGGGFRFGGPWTAVVVAQVAAMVALPVLAFYLRGEAAEIRAVDFGVPAEEFMAIRLEMDVLNDPGTANDASRTAFLARFTAAVRALEERLEAEPAVAGVTFADGPTLMDRAARRIEVDDGGAATPRSASGHIVKSAAVAVDYLDLMNAPILAGRGFTSGDLESHARVVIVNQSFVDRVLAAATRSDDGCATCRDRSRARPHPRPSHGTRSSASCETSAGPSATPIPKPPASITPSRRETRSRHT